jgi:7,8-dihydropterin-6-yl-methyl-4-(beta-D-ribofuranosyl)aminobenzene 5'-phosphate synthase
MRAWRDRQHTEASAASKRFYALLGGFRLAPAPDDYLRQVMAELRKFDLDHVMPMHCSGQNFIDLAGKEMPEKLVLCGTGSSFTFTARAVAG